jgi:hypothetical protein
MRKLFGWNVVFRSFLRRGVIVVHGFFKALDRCAQITAQRTKFLVPNSRMTSAATTSNLVILISPIDTFFHKSDCVKHHYNLMSLTVIRRAHTIAICNEMNQALFKNITSVAVERNGGCAVPVVFPASAISAAA